MSVALKGQPVAGLPSGAWRSENIALPEEIAKPMDDLIGLFTGESSPAPRPQSARTAPAPRPSAPIAADSPERSPLAAASPAPRNPPSATAPRAIEDLLPPEDIPTVGSIERPRQKRAAPERSIFEDLFGGG